MYPQNDDELVIAIVFVLVRNFPNDTYRETAITIGFDNQYRITRSDSQFRHTSSISIADALCHDGHVGPFVLFVSWTRLKDEVETK
jgi:hypothetical protein